MLFKVILHSLIQFGTDPDHVPFGKHLIMLSPQRTYNRLQKYVTVEPIVVLSINAKPFDGIVGRPQPIAKVNKNPTIISFFNLQ